MFTGKRRVDTQTHPSELVKDLDPAVERIILRCLEEDPKRRPSSALNVAMALPGGDPIAAALAAGETPSPELVAASGEKEGFSSRTAILWFVLTMVVMALVYLNVFTKDRPLMVVAPPEIPPDALAFRAQDMLRDFGYNEKPGMSVWGFDCCDGQNLKFVESLRRRSGTNFWPAIGRRLPLSFTARALKRWLRFRRVLLPGTSQRTFDPR
jgi:hypothetical protein